jgi:type II secretory pathway component PulK
MKRSRSRRGYALLMTLVLVLLATVAMVGLAQRSLLGALESQDAETHLRTRWAMVSTRAALLGRLEEQMDRSERGLAPDGSISARYLHRPARRLSHSFTLAGIGYQIVITDEQAKVNVNQLLATGSDAEARSLIRRLVPPGAQGEVRLRPRRLDNGKGPEIGAYGQVFESVGPHRILGAQASKALAANVTCWGTGRVNVRRASEQALRALCAKSLTGRAVTSLLAQRDKDPYRSLEAMLAGADEIDDRQKEEVRKLLTDKSTCHGLWIVARDQHRSWYTLAVSVSVQGQVLQWFEFAW